MKQTHTSAATSINAHKLPRVYNLATFTPGEIILDFGCGKYTDHIQKALPEGVTYYPYDPYNQPQAVNYHSTVAIDIARDTGHPVTVICSNVLNVIDSAEGVAATAALIETIARKTGGRLLVTVYEGDRSGNGRETGPDQWQRNERTADYLKYFHGARIHHGVITESFGKEA